MNIPSLICTFMDIFIVILMTIGIWHDVLSFSNDQPEHHYAIYWLNAIMAMVRFLLAFYFKIKSLNIIMIIFCGFAIIRGCFAVRLFVEFGLYHRKKDIKKQSFL